MRRFCLLSAAILLLFTGCGGADPVPLPSGWERTELRYAERFTIDRDAVGRTLVTVNGADRFLLIPEGVEMSDGNAVSDSDAVSDGNAVSDDGTVPELPGDMTIIRLPLSRLYIASSSVLDFFDRLDALDAVRFTSTRSADWTLPAVRAAVERGDLRFAGKYSAPDFEALLAENCPLAVENTMILHSPDIREQLEALGIPVLVERSSYEPHPLGRMEWIKLYGLLTGREREAEVFFEEQAEAVERIQSREETGKTAAIFSITPNGAVTVRKPGDYAVKMLELAGGRYAFADLSAGGDSALSSVNLQMEAFYAGARDADVLIYNGTIDGGVNTLDQLLDKSALLADFRAVRSGEVWCTERNLFQEPTAAAEMIGDFRAALDGTGGDSLTYLHRLT